MDFSSLQSNYFQGNFNRTFIDYLANRNIRNLDPNIFTYATQQAGSLFNSTLAQYNPIAQNSLAAILDNNLSTMTDAETITANTGKARELLNMDKSVFEHFKNALSNQAFPLVRAIGLCLVGASFMAAYNLNTVKDVVIIVANS